MFTHYEDMKGDEKCKNRGGLGLGVTQGHQKHHHRARQLYKNISMLFLFPVKTVSLVQASIHIVSYIRFK